MKHNNEGRKAALRAAQPQEKTSLHDPEGVEILLRLRREKTERENRPLPAPDRSKMMGELKLDLGDGKCIVTGWFDIDRELALAWLDYNKDNRKVKLGKVQSFARQLANGDYVLTHQGIAFNDANELIDGQHSLKAVVMTGITMRRMVTFGIPKKIAGKSFNTMDVLDQGGRTVGDQLKIQHGVKDPNTVRQICNAIASLCNRRRARNLSVGQIMNVYNLFRADVDWVIANRSKVPGLRQMGILAGFTFAHAALPAPVEKLFTSLNTGEGLVDAEAFKKIKAAGKEARPLEHLRYFLTGGVGNLLGKKLNSCLAEVSLQTIYAEQHKARTKEIESSDVGVNWFAAKQKERVDKIAAMFKLPPPNKLKVK